MRKLAILSVAGLLMAMLPSHASAVSFFQGFETDTSGWFDYGNGSVVRVPSGYTNGGGYADGINSAAGNYHARLDVDPLATSPACVPGSVDCVGPYTFWGSGGAGVPLPAAGSVTQTDIYLDVGFAMTHPDYRFDYDSSLLDANGDFLSDFVFNAGTANPARSVACAPASSNAYFVISAGQNAFRNSSYPQNPGHNPQCISTSGWYTFRHTFRNNGGNLEVDMDILDQGGTAVASWTIMPQIGSSPVAFSDVGYNYYGWFPNQEIDELAIDNTSLHPAQPTTKEDCKNGGWVSFGFRNQGQCVSSIVSQRDK